MIRNLTDYGGNLTSYTDDDNVYKLMRSPSITDNFWPIDHTFENGDRGGKQYFGDRDGS